MGIKKVNFNQKGIEQLPKDKPVYRRLSGRSKKTPIK